jgi:hypothetical protein
VLCCGVVCWSVMWFVAVLSYVVLCCGCGCVVIVLWLWCAVLYCICVLSCVVTLCCVEVLFVAV